MMKLLGAFLLSVMCSTASNASDALLDAPRDFREIVQEAKANVFPAVVYIRCIRETHEEGKRTTQQVSGSGVIISPDGEVLTNWHVIDKAISVRCLLSDGRHMDARIVGSDKDVDLALLQFERTDETVQVPHAVLGESSGLSEGDFVMAMGAPFGLNRSVSIGIISCTQRYLDGVSEYSHWLQTDAAINPGNSGGPLINTQGEIVGINSLGMQYAEDMGFSIPADTIQTLLPRIRQYGQVNWSWTGLQLQPLRDFNRDMYFNESEGVIVAETDPGSPARTAGLKPRDRILSVNGRRVTATTEEDLPRIRRMLGLLSMDEPATFEYMRGTEQFVLDIAPRGKGKVEGDELACDRWDFTVKTINQFDNPDLYFYQKEGVYVLAVKYPGNARSAGLWSKDILLSIDGTPVTTLDDVRAIHEKAIANVNTRHRIPIMILRGGLQRHLVLDFSRDYEKE